MNWFCRVVLVVVLDVLLATAPCAQVASQGKLPSAPKPYDRAFDLLQAGKPNDALAELDTALTTEPDDPALNNLRGLVTAQLGRKAEAEASFR